MNNGVAVGGNFYDDDNSVHRAFRHRAGVPPAALAASKTTLEQEFLRSVVPVVFTVRHRRKIVRLTRPAACRP